jgi:hypothetical protein
MSSEPGGVLVELPHPRIDVPGGKLGPGQLVEGGDDADVGRVGEVGAAEHLGQLADVAGPDVPGPGCQRHDEGEVCCWDPLGQQADLRVPEQQRRQHPVGEHRAAGDRRCWHGPPSRGERLAHDKPNPASNGRVAQVGVTTSAVGVAYATWSSFPVVGLVVSSAIEASLR